METPQPKTGPIEILFSYTRKDEELRNKIEVHLAPLKRSGRITCWHDRQIQGGSKWNLSISTHLDTADIILLLISPDFLNSDYCNQVEVKRALERHEKGEIHLVPIILRPSDWKDEKFAELQSLPTDAKPVVKWELEDDALHDITKHLKILIKTIETARASTEQKIS